MRLIYMGSPEASKYPLDHLIKTGEAHSHQVIAVVSQAPKSLGRGLQMSDPPLAQFAKSLNIQTFQPEKASDPHFQAELKALAPDVIITCAYGQILNSSFLEIPTRAVINIHPSLLPQYRGATPTQSALLDNHVETGITILFTVKELDAGSIILQKTIAILADETYDELLTRLFTLAGPLLTSALEKLKDNSFRGTPQDASKVTHCRKIKKEDGEINWDQNRLSIYNRFRAFYPWPGSFSFLNQKRVLIMGMKIQDPLRGWQGEPGELCYRKDEKALYVACADGPIKLTHLKPEGSKMIEANAFWNGLKNRDQLKFQNLSSSI